jgi:KaiC/GvpD/RAD55 family RecA-like ATPase
MSSHESHGRLSHMADNIVFLDLRTQDGVVGRMLRIAKARGVKHDLQAREISIDDGGLRVLGARG